MDSNSDAFIFPKLYIGIIYYYISVISKSPHSSWDQKVEMGLCLLGAPKHGNMFVCPHLLRLSGLTFQKSPQRLYTKGPARSRRWELTWIHTRLSVFSFLFRASRYLSVHWLHFFCPPTNILTTFTAPVRLSCHSPSGKSVNANMNICENKIWHYHHRRLWRTAEMSVRMLCNWLILVRGACNAAQMWF